MNTENNTTAQELDFDFSGFAGVKNGQKTQTSTPILDVKGHINKFGLNKAALDFMGVNKLSNIYLLENRTEGVALGSRYVAVVLQREFQDQAFPGARVMIKDSDTTNNSGSFQYAVIWGNIHSNTLLNMSKEELTLKGFVKEVTAVNEDGSKVKRTSGVKVINFEIKAIKEMEISQLASIAPELVGLQGTAKLFALHTPVEESFDYRIITKKSNPTPKIKEVESFDKQDDVQDDNDFEQVPA
jgi:hypothetical protein